MSSQALPHAKQLEEKEDVVIRFAGDSGDGMQLTGTQFTSTAAIVGNDLATLPDYPAEIRAPAGSLAGVSAFQLNFSSREIRTPGDQPDVLVAMNPAALKTNIRDVPAGGIIIVNKDAFIDRNLERAGYKSNPLEDSSMQAYRVFQIPITSLNQNALNKLQLTGKEKDRCKNFFALGMMYWMYDRPLDVTIHWIEGKFKNPEVAKANVLALKAGYHYAETSEVISTHYKILPAKLKPGKYRNIMGNEATAIGFVAASELANTPLLYCSYPITPASDILHELSKLKNFGVKTFQAEDEIAAIGAAIGGAYTGAIALTGTSGPGLALKSEALNLAVMAELPLVVINVQRGGPSTGLPTKTEQADLLQSMFGRNGESPVPILAPATPGECFNMAIEAVRISIKYMTPVLYLSDGYLANGSEPWLIPSVNSLKKIEVKYANQKNIQGEKFLPYLRDAQTLARPWAVPGTEGMEHRIGGLEKEDVTGNVSYDPINHQKMIDLRASKVAGIANEIPPIEVCGKAEGDVLVVGWGGTYGAITSAVEHVQKQGAAVSSIHIRYLNPFPKNLGDILRRFKKVLIAELNLGQLSLLIRSKYLVDAKSLCKVQGKPFKIQEIVEGIQSLLSSSSEVKNVAASV